MCAVFILDNGAPVEMVETGFEKESDLQRLLEVAPELLSAEAPEDERRGWLLVKREIGVPGREGGSDRFSLDHLFVDQDARPTFVEVKRSSNREIRRTVVGQMLDYAANAAAYWEPGSLKAAFEARFDSPEGANEELQAFLDGEWEADEFWSAVESNLESRALRLVFVADRIPRELRSTVEFLNEQLKLTEVNAVEIKRYVTDDGRANIVPHIIGDTEMARRVKRTAARTGTRRPRATAEQFTADIRAAYAPELAERVLALFEHLTANASRSKFGRGEKASANFWVGEDEDPAIANPIAIKIGTHSVTVKMRDIRNRREPEEMKRLVEMLRALPGTSDELDKSISRDYRSYCHFPTQTLLATNEDLAEFERVIDEASVRSDSLG